MTVTAGSMPLLRPNLTVSRLTKTVWTKTASKRCKSVQKLSTNLASTCYRISKTTMQCYIKQSRGLKVYRRPQQPKYPKNSQKGSWRLKNLPKRRKNWRDEDIWQQSGVTSSSLSWTHARSPKRWRFSLEEGPVPQRLK